MLEREAVPGRFSKIWLRVLSIAICSISFLSVESLRGETLPDHVTSIVIGTPVGLGLGVEHEWTLNEANSLAVEIGSASLLAADGDVIETTRQFEIAMLYRHYQGREALIGGYGLIGAGILNAETTGGNLLLYRFLGGGGYKWMPAKFFAFSFQGGVSVGNSGEVTQRSSEGGSLFVETIIISPVSIFLTIQLAFPF